MTSRAWLAARDGVSQGAPLVLCKVGFFVKFIFSRAMGRPAPSVLANQVMSGRAGTDHKSRVFGLDVLRAGAIVMVLAAHLWPSRLALGVATGLGVLGVELFFVLSGFLIGRILLDLQQSGRLETWGHVLEFWRRRWWRTLPAYFLFLTLHLSWRTWALSFPDQISLNWQYFFFVQNFAQPSSNFFPETWSLSVEEWFYLLFPLVLVIALRISPKPWQAWAVVMGVFLLAPAILRLSQVVGTPQPGDAGLWALRNQWDAVPRKVVVFRLDAVIYGVLAATISVWKPGVWRRVTAPTLTGFALILVAAVSLAFNAPLDRASSVQGWMLLPLISVGFALLLPACSQWAVRPRMWTRSVSWIAKISYSLYLCHGLVLLGLAKWFGPNSSLPLPRNTWTWAITASVVSVIFASVVYRWFEKPMMDQRDRAKPEAALTESMVATGCSTGPVR